MEQEQKTVIRKDFKTNGEKRTIIGVKKYLKDGKITIKNIVRIMPRCGKKKIEDIIML